MTSYQIFYQSPIGVFRIVATENKIQQLEFVRATKKMSSETQKDAPQILKDCIQQLNEYFSHQRKVFDLPLCLEGTQFQKRVWLELKKVSLGQTRSYGEIAKLIKRPRACRAVGMANHKNKLPILIPCHRIVGADGSLVGYAGGLWRKMWLLKHEKRL